MDNFEKVLTKEIEYNLQTIANKCKEILQDEISRQVYDKYDPKQYRRTFELRDNVKTKIKNNILYVYINTGNMHYENFNKDDVTDKVPYWINYGHNSKKYKRFMLFQYPSQGFIEKAKQRIERELGLEVEIINNTD